MTALALRQPLSRLRAAAGDRVVLALLAALLVLGAADPPQLLPSTRFVLEALVSIAPFLALAVATDLTATATVRRRGGTLCTGDVSVRNGAGDEVATAIVTYKLTGYHS